MRNHYSDTIIFILLCFLVFTACFQDINENRCIDVWANCLFRDINKYLYSEKQVKSIIQEVNKFEDSCSNTECELVHPSYQTGLPDGLSFIYSELINNFDILGFDTDFAYFLNNDDVYQNYSVNEYFFLYDFNKDGKPELVIKAIENIGVWGRGARGIVLFIYTYQSNEAILIGKMSTLDEFIIDPFSNFTRLTTARIINIDVLSFYSIGFENGMLVEFPLLERERSVHDSNVFEYRFQGRIITENEFDLKYSLLLDVENRIQIFEMTSDNLLEALSKWKSSM